MKHARLIYSSILTVMALLLLLSNSGAAGAAEPTYDAAQIAISPSEPAAPALNNTHLVMYGTAWVPERRGQIKFTYIGWGTIFQKKKAAGGEWVHIPIPLATYVKGVSQKISSVEFCAKISSANSRPTEIDLWDVDNRFYIGTITGWPVNKVHCHSVGFNPPVWRSSLGMSVHLSFANLTDTIVMYKAWVNLTE
jgi:hypothetical protein